MIKIYCDGGARGNPGPAASAFVVLDMDGNLLHKDAKFIGDTTNNVAEYTALILALEWLTENQNSDCEIYLDSELVQKQMTGKYKIKNLGLKSLAMRAKNLERELTISFKYIHTRREGNPLSDALVNETLDAQS